MLVFPTAPSPTSMQLTSSLSLLGLSCLWQACAMFPHVIIPSSQHFESPRRSAALATVKDVFFSTGPLVPIKGEGHLNLKEQKRPIRRVIPKHFVCFRLMQIYIVTPTKITGKGQLVWP